MRALLGRRDAGGDPPPRAVIDIGSNSLRLVVYVGPARLPRVVLNEKVSANLGRSLSIDGQLPTKAMETALRGLSRFARLTGAMGVGSVRTVATAAVREAGNGAAFLERVRALGLDPELLSGEEEASASALGLVSAFPDADGIVGDLGGGSLELVEVSGREAGRGASFPVGTLRLPALRAKGPRAFGRRLSAMLDAEWKGAASGRTFYLVARADASRHGGGSLAAPRSSRLCVAAGCCGAPGARRRPRVAETAPGGAGRIGLARRQSPRCGGIARRGGAPPSSRAAGDVQLRSA